MQGRTMRLYRTSLVLLAACITIAGCASSPGDTGGETPTGAAPSPPSEAPGLTLVAIGDSIPYNSEDDCPGCTGYIDRYTDAVSAATGQPVEVLNLSQHTGLTLPQLLDTLYSYEEDVAGAEVIVVGIAHNSSELATFRPCGAPKDDEGLPEWSKIDDVVACAEASAEKFRPQFESLYSQIAAWREGEPTILRAINRYNDWIGWREAALGPDEEQKTKIVLDPWSAMVCEAAETNGFGCADIYHAFNGPDGLRPSGRLLAGDYTHPSDRGNELIADVLVDIGFEPLA